MATRFLAANGSTKSSEIDRKSTLIPEGKLFRAQLASVWAEASVAKVRRPSPGSLHGSLGSVTMLVWPPETLTSQNSFAPQCGVLAGTPEQ